MKYRGNQLKLLPPFNLIEYIALSKCFNLDGYTCFKTYELSFQNYVAEEEYCINEEIRIKIVKETTIKFVTLREKYAKLTSFHLKIMLQKENIAK